MTLDPVSSQPSSSIAVRLEKLQKLHQVLTKKDKSDKDISKALASLNKIDQDAIRAKIAIQGTGSSKAMPKEKLISFVKGQMKKLSPLKTDSLFQASIKKSNPFSDISPDLQSTVIGPFLCPNDVANFGASFKDAAAIEIASHIIKKNALDSLIETYLHRSCADLTESEKIQALHELMCMAYRLSEIEELPRPSYSSLHAFFQEVEARNLIRMMEKIHQAHPFPDLSKGVKNLKVPKDAQWTVLKAKRLRYWMRQHEEFFGTIVRLDLSRHQLSLLPKEIGQLKALQKLYLDYNRLVSMPKEISQLQALQSLWLDHNLLASLPKEIGQLQALQKLWLDHNLLASVPKEIGQLKALLQLSLDNNGLIDIFPELKARFKLNLKKQNKQLQLKTILKKLTLCVTGTHDNKGIVDLLNTMEKLLGKETRSQLHRCMCEVARQAAKADESLYAKLKDPKFGRKALVDPTIDPKLKAAAIELFRKNLEKQASAKK